MIRLNLLPPDVKESIAYSKKNAALSSLVIELVACFVVLVTFVGVVGYVVFTNEQLANDDKAVAETQLASWKNTENDAKDFADRLNLVDKIRSNKIDWTLVFAEIAKSTPANIRLSSFDFTNNATDRVSFSGFALSNTDIGTFRELLAKSALFQYVDIESTTAATDPLDSSKNVLSFKITMNLNLSEAKK